MFAKDYQDIHSTLRHLSTGKMKRLAPKLELNTCVTYAMQQKLLESFRTESTKKNTFIALNFPALIYARGQLSSVMVSSTLHCLLVKPPRTHV